METKTEASTYDMHEQIAKSAEERIDLMAINLGFIPHRTKKDENRDGVDRWLQMPARRQILRVDYKNDTRTKDTGNVFIEIVSVRYTDGSGKDEKPGWIYKDRMDAVFYNVQNTDLILLMPRKILEEKAADWTKSYGTREIKNKGYVTIGIPVPLDVVKQLPGVETFDFAQAQRNPTERDGSWKRWIDIPYAMDGKIIHPPDENGVITSKRPDGTNGLIRQAHEQYHRWMRIFRGYMPASDMVSLLREERRCWRVKSHPSGEREVFFGPNSWMLPEEGWVGLRADDDEFLNGLALHVLSHVERRAMARYTFSNAIEEKAA